MSDSKPMILVSGGINWTWYCHVAIDSKGYAIVDKEYRLHDFDTMSGAGKHPKETNGTYSIVERKRDIDGPFFQRRIATGIVINGKEYKFHKPCERFSLGEGV